ncbi:MAG: GxxExxY protein [Oscillospiraceae bacterium]|nr:GxxExxY protein [Oscillospiraceae bacterium]
MKILRCAFETCNTLKAGYLESVYEAALEYELLQAGFSVSRQVRIPVFYKGVELRKDFYEDLRKPIACSSHERMCNIHESAKYLFSCICLPSTLFCGLRFFDFFRQKRTFAPRGWGFIWLKIES